MRKIIVTGCGRSGTAYSAAIWRALGLDVGHEQWGEAGISAFQVAHPLHRKNYEWDKHINGVPPIVFHIVRHPLNVISSWMGRPDTLVGMLDGAEQWEPLERCARYWLQWNQLVEREFPLVYRYRIETVQDRIREWALLAGMTPTEEQMTKAKAVPTNYGTAHASIKTHGSHKYEHVYTWTELVELIPHELVRQIGDQAVRYGYLT